MASDVWKIWIAEMLQRKSKLITYMHGGGFPLQSYDLECSEPKHELKISTKRISWFRHSNNPSVQLSPLKALKFKDIKYTSNKNKFLSSLLFFCLVYCLSELFEGAMHNKSNVTNSNS